MGRAKHTAYFRIRYAKFLDAIASIGEAHYQFVIKIILGFLVKLTGEDYVRLDPSSIRRNPIANHQVIARWLIKNWRAISDTTRIHRNRLADFFESQSDRYIPVIRIF